MLEKIDKTINRELNRFNLKRASQAAYICQVADEIGKNYNFRAKSYKNSVLTITVSNNIVAQEIQFQKQMIIFEINKKIRHESVKRLVYKIEN